MKRFITNILLLIIPIIIIVIPYFVLDPFKVLRDYDLYGAPGNPMYVNINRTLISQKMFDRYRDFYGWDSYVFGGSRSGYYRYDIWSEHLDSTASIAHLDGYGESLYNIYHKVKYIDGKTPIKNALLCIDEQVLFKTENELNPINTITPDLDPTFSKLDFHALFLKAYLTPSFFVGYLHFKISGKLYPYMLESQKLQKSIYYYDMTHNEMLNENDFKNIPDSVYYNEKRMALFPKERPTEQQYFKPVVKDEQVRMLTEIKQIFEKNGTNYKVIINPIYDQKKLCDSDMQKLYDIFGEDLIYDYSGINFITNDYHNWADTQHFNKHCARQMLKWVYVDNAHTISEGQTDFDL